jgi:hypothetical protein
MFSKTIKSATNEMAHVHLYKTVKTQHPFFFKVKYKFQAHLLCFTHRTGYSTGNGQQISGQNSIQLLAFLSQVSRGFTQSLHKNAGGTLKPTKTASFQIFTF